MRSATPRSLLLVLVTAGWLASGVASWLVTSPASWIAVAGSFAAFGELAGAGPAWAQEEADEEAQKRELERVRRQAAEKRKRARELQVRESRILRELRSTERSLRTTHRNVGQLTARIRELRRQLDIVRAELTRSRAALGDQRTLLSRRLRNVYKFGRARELEFLISARSFAQLFVRWDFLARIARQDRRLLLGITEEKRKIESNQRQLDLTALEVDRTLTAKQREEQRLARLRQSKRTTVSQIQDQRKEYEAAAAELEQTARRIERLLADLERRRREEEARRRAEAEGRKEPPPPAPYEGEFAKARGALAWPVRGEIVGHFGNERHPRFGTVTMNNGIDIRAPMGADVRAVAKGRVDFTSEDYGSYGQMLILNHGSGYYTLYAHCSAILAARGQEVAAGQTIAKVGASGSHQGTILHVEVRKGRAALDPLAWRR